MSPRTFLVAMTAVAVVGDSLLHPFFPQYFRAVFGVTDSVHVGFYVAACSLTVLLSFPVWALLSRKVSTPRLLIATQLACAVFACATSAAGSLGEFWALSLTMMALKASYLLIYPYVMSLEEKERHQGTIGLLAFVVYFGHLLAALMAGFILQILGPRPLFLAMAAGDVLQATISLFAVKARVFSARSAPIRSPLQEGSRPMPRGFLAKLGLLMCVLYFSAYVTEPFFSEYWESRSSVTNRIISGLVFALPGIAALMALIIDARFGSRPSRGMARGVWLVVVGLLLQLFGPWPAAVAGRFLYGWALFRTMVELDLILFQVSTPDDYAVDFSRANFFQGLGVMIASSTAGSLVHVIGPAAPFVTAAVAFMAGALFHLVWVRPALHSIERTALVPDTGPGPEALPS